MATHIASKSKCITGERSREQTKLIRKGGSIGYGLAIPAHEDPDETDQPSNVTDRARSVITPCAMRDRIVPNGSPVRAAISEYDRPP